MKHNFKIGDKVIPISKSTCGSLAQSVVYKKMMKDNQGFLFVTEINTMGANITCDTFESGTGDYFLPQDLVLVPQLKRGMKVYVSDESMQDALDRKNIKTFIGTTNDGFLCTLDDLDLEEGEDYFEVGLWIYVIAIPEPVKPVSITIPLTAHYSVEIFKDKIIVGCQTISSEKITEVCEHMKTLNL